MLTFLNFGLIREYKRVDVIIQAAQNAYEQTGKRFKVIIAGSCDNWSTYQEKIKYPELFDLRIDWIDDKQVPDLFAEADYFVAPYQDIAQSGSAIIALNYNLPIIASKLESFESFIDDGVTGYLIRPASVEDLTETMVRVLNIDRSKYNEMKRTIEKRKHEQFSVEAVSKLYRKNIDTVIDGMNRV